MLYCGSHRALLPLRRDCGGVMFVRIALLFRIGTNRHSTLAAIKGHVVVVNEGRCCS